MSKRLMWVETNRKKDMQAFFCNECNALFDPLPCWSIRASLDMHLRFSGHKDIVLLKIDEVEESNLRIVGKAFSRVDLLLHAQGKPQPLDVTIYQRAER